MILKNSIKAHGLSMKSRRHSGKSYLCFQNPQCFIQFASKPSLAQSERGFVQQTSKIKSVFLRINIKCAFGRHSAKYVLFDKKVKQFG